MKFYAFLLITITSIFFASCDKESSDDPELMFAPSNLIYNPNSITTTVGTIAATNTPSIEGTNPITFTLTSTPDANNAISINPNTGEISVSDKATIGSYKVSVRAENSEGSENFPEIFTVNVANKSTDKITYNADIRAILTTKCAPCHVYGGQQVSFETYSKSKADIKFILDRINKEKGSKGFMPKNGEKLDATTLATILQWKVDGLLE